MKKNMSGIDRIIRLILILAVGGLYYFNIINGTVAIVLMVVAVILLITTFVSSCPIYSLIGVSTRKD